MWILFKVIHVMAVVLAIGISIGPEILLNRIARSNDVRAIRAGFKMASPLAKAAPPFYVAGLLTGLGAVWSGGWNFAAPWLLISYGIFAVMIALDAGFRVPWVKRVLAAATASPDGALSAELQSALADRRGTITTWAGPPAILIMVFLMVYKPFQ
jgi:uncharacterized membrane protein